MKMIACLAVLSCVVGPPAGRAAGDARAPAGAPPEVTLANTEVRTLESKIVDQEFRLLIARPFQPPGPNGTYPVLYLLDAEISFPLVRQVALSLQSGFELPPILIVGIDYAGGMREAMVRRTRDYTPTPDPLFVKHARRWGGGASGDDASGGAAAFLRFVREELKPFIQANYPADPDDATIFGASFGGLFGAYALFHHPDTFQRYVLSSPSLWWDGRVTFDFETRYAAEHDDLPARVFLAAGGHETAEHDAEQLAKLPDAMRRPMLEFQEAIEGAAQMVEVIEPFVEKLSSRAYPSLDLTLHIFPGETHGSVPPMTVSRGLRVVFEMP